MTRGSIFFHTSLMSCWKNRQEENHLATLSIRPKDRWVLEQQCHPITDKEYRGTRNGHMQLSVLLDQLQRQFSNPLRKLGESY